MRLSQEALVGVVSSKVRFSALAPWLWRRKKRVGVAAGRVFFTRSASRHRASISVSAGAYLVKSPAVHRHQPYLSYQIFSLRPLTGSSDGDLVGLQPMGLTRGEQHGEDDPSEPGHGSQDHHVAWLALLPRLVLLGWDELGAEFVQLAVRCFQLLIDQPDADDQHADMVARRLDHPGCDRASSGKVENNFWSARFRPPATGSEATLQREPRSASYRDATAALAAGARGEPIRCSLAPSNRLPRLWWQAEGECVDRDRLVLSALQPRRPRRVRDCGGTGASPGGHTEVLGPIPGRAPTHIR